MCIILINKVFFEDNSGHIMEDDTLARLISMPNVIVTSHQAFLTEEALANIAKTETTPVKAPAITGPIKRPTTASLTKGIIK